MSEFMHKHVVVTCADVYMGAPIAAHFEELGARVTRDFSALVTQAEIDALVETAGDTDILIINLDEPPHTCLADAITDEDWFALADKLVHPLMRLVRGFLPAMKAKQSGKIIAVTSAAPLRGIAKNSAYCAMRGAQNAFIRAVGLELARDNVQVNAIGQNYVRNETYYPDSLIANEKFQAHLKAQVPTLQVAPETETARLAAFLASAHNTHIVGQIIPFAGGWA